MVLYTTGSFSECKIHKIQLLAVDSVLPVVDSDLTA